MTKSERGRHSEKLLSPLDPSHLPVGTLQLQSRGRAISFQFPDTGDMRDHLERVFKGFEYPLLRMPQYQPGVIVDIGANVGASALFFHAAFPTATIYCYEPSPTNLGFLKQNLSAVQRAEVFGYGLSDRDEQVKLYIGQTQFMQNSVIPSVETQERFEMAELRRASIELERLRIKEISILKIDTEGCELPILRDIKAWIASIDLLYVEYHSEEDRVIIDELARSGHVLGRAATVLPHRGTNLYVSRRMLTRFPHLDMARIGPRQPSGGA